jgi:arylsulfatase A-like enzyme
MGQASRPNMVVILADDAAFNAFGFNAALHGTATHYETPNIDALAQQSVVARQAYAAASLCSNSRAGLLTGQYGQRYGFEYNIDRMETALPQAQGLRADQLTIAQHLKTLGYSTGAIGKWHLGWGDGLNLPLDKGFDEFFGFLGGGRFYFSEHSSEGVMRRGDDIYEAEYRAGGHNTPGDPNRNDPVRGRYATDAFADEAIDFIDRHAAEENPYFLYLPFNAPHAPLEAKQWDMERFAHIADPLDQVLAAVTYAFDRSVGRIRDAIAATGEETIIIVTNDNGYPADENPPLRGRKGLYLEGSLRTPFLINAPGLAPGVYDAPITALDVLPTLYAAAGGDISQLQTDGVDLMPYLSGDNPEDPHELIINRANVIWSIRRGDWKFGSPDAGPLSLYNLANDPGETTNLVNQHPDIAAELYREMTYWEADMDKPRWGPNAGNPFDHFVFSGVSATFNAHGAFKGPMGEAVQLRRADGYPNLILEFQTRDDNGFGGTNNWLRMTSGPMMINELRLTGNFAGSVNRGGGINGNPLLFVTSLHGSGPTIRLDSTSSGTNARFGWDIGVEIQLLDDLEITGNGTQNFSLNGAIRDFYEPRSVRKSGSSSVTLRGHNTFRGDFEITGGQVKITGDNGAVNGANSINIGGGATLAMDNGLINVNRIDRSAGGAFQFTGGELRTVDFVGNLTNQGGNFSPGNSVSLTSIAGDYSQASGKLTMELNGTMPGVQYDRLTVTGSASLGGTLQVDLINSFVPDPGDVYMLLQTLGGVNDSFANTILPVLPAGLSWRLDYGPLDVRLHVDGSGVFLPGDYDRDNSASAADFVLWRKAMSGGAGLAADGNGDGRVDIADYTVWRRNFGRTTTPAASGALSSVPEPAAALLALLAMTAVCAARRQRS